MKKVLIRFLKYWKKGNYSKMYELCQKTWKRNHTQGQLKAMFSGKNLESFDVIGVGNPKEALNSLLCDVVIDGASKAISPNLICETAPYKPSVNGVWGVNPISVFKKVNNG